MSEFWDYLQKNWQDLLGPLVLLCATVALGWGLRFILNKASARPAARGEQDLVLALSRSVLLWSLLLGIYLASSAAPLPAAALAIVNQGLLILWVTSLTLAGSRLAANLVARIGGKIPGSMAVTSLTQNLARWLVITIGLLILLSLVGVSITPILTALGVGGLAVALALKDTLSNLFAGFYVSLAGLIRPGDYIKLDSGQEGYVIDIGWRCTTLRMSANNLIILPNEKLAQAIVTNYTLPEQRLGLSIPVNVGYGCDPDQVVKLLVEVATEGAQDIPGLLADPPPGASLNPGFGDFALQFTLGCQVASFSDQGPVQHELRKRILKRFREAGIEIPFPAQTVYLHRPGPQKE